jgi:hypothetical protein
VCIHTGQQQPGTFCAESNWRGFWS